MKSNLDITPPSCELALHAGPLHYQLRAHDSWGQRRLAELASHIAQPTRTRAQSDRIIHLHQLKEDKRTHSLPQVLRSYLPEEDPTLTWTRHDNLLNSIWQNRDSMQTFWTGGANPGLGDFRYQLPWDVMIKDMVEHGGGLIHGGLVVHQDEAVLFLAPPGGGKTTTLASATDEWQVLGDDSALVWPSADGSWQASPMPTWSCLIKQTEPISAGKLALGNHYPLKAVIYLNKTACNPVVRSSRHCSGSPYLPFFQVSTPRRFWPTPCIAKISSRPPAIWPAIFPAGSLGCRSVPIFGHCSTDKLKALNMNDQQKRLFRYHGLSMWPCFQEGDLLEILPVDWAKIRIGDCLVFWGENGQQVVHRVTGKGKSLRTRGDAFKKADECRPYCRSRLLAV